MINDRLEIIKNLAIRAELCNKHKMKDINGDKIGEILVIFPTSDLDMNSKINPRMVSDIHHADIVMCAYKEEMLTRSIRNDSYLCLKNIYTQILWDVKSYVNPPYVSHGLIPETEYNENGRLNIILTRPGDNSLESITGAFVEDMARRSTGVGNPKILVLENDINQGTRITSRILDCVSNNFDMTNGTVEVVISKNMDNNYVNKVSPLLGIFMSGFDIGTMFREMYRITMEPLYHHVPIYVMHQIPRDFDIKTYANKLAEKNIPRLSAVFSVKNKEEELI